MNNYLPTILFCAPMMISFSYLIKKTYHENNVKRKLIKKYNKFEDPTYNPFKKYYICYNNEK
tara:strand:- start:1254 stop:1439 length:186 start_codon:yes stop_codon:yes gene_type:complete